MAPRFAPPMCRHTVFWVEITNCVFHVEICIGKGCSSLRFLFFLKRENLVAALIFLVHFCISYFSYTVTNIQKYVLDLNPWPGVEIAKLVSQSSHLISMVLKKTAFHIFWWRFFIATHMKNPWICTEYSIYFQMWALFSKGSYTCCRSFVVHNDLAIVLVTVHTRDLELLSSWRYSCYKIIVGLCASHGDWDVCFEIWTSYPRFDPDHYHGYL